MQHLPVKLHQTDPFAGFSFTSGVKGRNNWHQKEQLTDFYPIFEWFVYPIWPISPPFNEKTQDSQAISDTGHLFRCGQSGWDWFSSLLTAIDNRDLPLLWMYTKNIHGETDRNISHGRLWEQAAKRHRVQGFTGTPWIQVVYSETTRESRENRVKAHDRSIFHRNSQICNIITRRWKREGFNRENGTERERTTADYAMWFAPPKRINILFIVKPQSAYTGEPTVSWCTNLSGKPRRRCRKWSCIRPACL